MQIACPGCAKPLNMPSNVGTQIAGRCPACGSIVRFPTVRKSSGFETSRNALAAARPTEPPPLPVTKKKSPPSPLRPASVASRPARRPVEEAVPRARRVRYIPDEDEDDEEDDEEDETPVPVAATTTTCRSEGSPGRNDGVRLAFRCRGPRSISACSEPISSWRSWDSWRGRPTARPVSRCRFSPSSSSASSSMRSPGS